MPKKQTKPPLFKLVHNWNLPAGLTRKLSYYKLATLSASDLAQNLDTNRGMLVWESHRFIPIYSYCTRNDIKYGDPESDFIVSFRILDSVAVALVQLERKLN